jgi:hypothetical protein
MTSSTADLRRNWRLIWGVTPRFWPEMKPELVIGRRVAAAVSLVGEDTPEGAADHCLHVRDHGCQGVTVIGIATLSSGVSRNSQSPLRRRRRTGACALHPVCRRACCMERVAAQHDHFLTRERSIKLLFVFAEFLPMVCFDPERVSADPYSAACAAISPWPDACH